MLSIILKPLSCLPLRLLHRIGAALGRVLFYCSSQAKKLAIDNLSQSKLTKSLEETQEIARQSFFEFGKAILEAPMIWQKAEADLLPLVQQIHGWEIVKNALLTFGTLLRMQIIMVSAFLNLSQLSTLLFQETSAQKQKNALEMTLKRADKEEYERQLLRLEMIDQWEIELTIGVQSAYTAI